MAKEKEKGIGPGVRTKGAGTGGMTDVPADKLGDNEILSNRDKKSYSAARGQDGKRIQSDQYQSHTHDKQIDE